MFITPFLPLHSVQFPYTNSFPFTCLEKATGTLILSSPKSKNLREGTYLTSFHHASGSLLTLLPSQKDSSQKNLHTPDISADSDLKVIFQYYTREVGSKMPLTQSPIKIVWKYSWSGRFMQLCLLLGMRQQHS